MSDYKRGRADERAAAVAWLRGCAEAANVLGEAEGSGALDDAANEIESGEHVPSESPFWAAVRSSAAPPDLTALREAVARWRATSSDDHLRDVVEEACDLERLREHLDEVGAPHGGCPVGRLEALAAERDAARAAAIEDAAQMAEHWAGSSAHGSEAIVLRDLADRMRSVLGAVAEPRTAEQERADVVAWLGDKQEPVTDGECALRSAAGLIEIGAHVGAANGGGR